MGSQSLYRQPDFAPYGLDTPFPASQQGLYPHDSHIQPQTPQPPSSSSPVSTRFTPVNAPWTMRSMGGANLSHNDELTPVCGVFSADMGPTTYSRRPVALTEPNLIYHCPRCEKPFSRRYTVKQHFPGCVRKFGNPHSLKWLDHPSLGGACSYRTRHPNSYNVRRRSTRGCMQLPQMSIAAGAEGTGTQQ